MIKTLPIPTVLIGNVDGVKAWIALTLDRSLDSMEFIGDEIYESGPIDTSLDYLGRIDLWSDSLVIESH